MKLSTCAEEYIKLIVKKMRYRRKIRGDVQKELTTHFEDELKDCQSDQDKEKKARQLIADFGDVDLLAILLRRAKKRCRPLWRTVVARTFQTVGVLILCFIFYMVWFLTGKPAITTNYVTELNRFVRPVPDESLNAEPLYRCAADLDRQEFSDDFLLFLAKNKNAIINATFPLSIKGFSEKIDKIVTDSDQKDIQQDRQSIRDDISKIFNELTKIKNDELNIEQKNFVKRLIQEREEALELIVQGSQRPYYWRTYKSDDDNPNEIISVLLPNLSEFKFLARLLRLRAFLHAEQGEYEDALNDLKSCYRLGKHLRGDKFLIEQLVGTAIEGLAIQSIQDIVAEYDISSAELTDLQHSFEQIIANENFLVSMETEKLAVYDQIQRCFTDGGLDGGHLYLARVRFLSSDGEDEIENLFLEAVLSPKKWPRALKVLFAHPNKKQTRKAAEQFFDFWTKLSLKTPAQINADRINPGKEAQEIITGNVFLQILTPALARVHQITYRCKTGIHATVTVLALLRYQKDKGSFPEDLQQLISAGYLKQLPDDAFSDKPLVYRKTEDDFILYCVGPDFIDNGGVSGKNRKGKDTQWRDEGDTIFWPVAK